MLELRGRYQQNEQGTGGVWLVFLVGLSFSTMSGFWLVDTSTNPNRALRFLGNIEQVLAGILGLAGVALLVFGALLALKRESLTVDFRQGTGVYRRWRMPGARTSLLEFSLEQTAGVSILERTESVAGGDGPTMRQQKWEARLHVKPRTIIPLHRSASRARVAQLADQVCCSLGVSLLSGRGWEQPPIVPE